MNDEDGGAVASSVVRPDGRERSPVSPRAPRGVVLLLHPISYSIRSAPAPYHLWLFNHRDANQ